MPLPRLHIGDRNYSSWSMRPWLALRHGGIAFEEVLHALPEMGDGKPAFGAISPNARVPALDWDGVVIAESLAICEWAAEQQPTLWPRDARLRALARSAAAIMHSGFPHLRNDAPMNIRRRTDASRMTPDGRADAARVDELWREWLGTLRRALPVRPVFGGGCDVCARRHALRHLCDPAFGCGGGLHLGHACRAAPGGVDCGGEQGNPSTSPL